jgi:alpha-methylacyl-CoA racemase
MSTTATSVRPLQGLRVLDFSTLLPGPYATLLLAEAGAEVIKIEKEQGGDELRMGLPRWGEYSINFALLNADKRSLALDLKQPQSRAKLLPLIREADVLVEQFRPGVMERLGLGYDELRQINPRLIYCSITGYAADGPSAQTAGHDLTYMADTGLLSLTCGNAGEPTLPPVLVADIGGGTMPAVMNILLALLQRNQTQVGSRISVSITDNLFAWPYATVQRGMALHEWPKVGGERLTGGTPRYQLYRAKDGRYIAVAALEDRFWQVFCDCVGLDPTSRDDRKDPAATKAAVAALIVGKDSGTWQSVFAGKDACACLVRTLEEASSDPQFRRLFQREIQQSDRLTPALVTPIDPQFRNPSPRPAPTLGEGNSGLISS